MHVIMHNMHACRSLPYNRDIGISDDWITVVRLQCLYNHYVSKMFQSLISDLYNCPGGMSH